MSEIEKKMNEVPSWKTTDGKEFFREDQAIAHQKDLDIKAFWDSKPRLTPDEERRFLRFMNLHCSNKKYSSVENVLKDPLGHFEVMKMGIVPSKIGRYMTDDGNRSYSWDDKERLLEYVDDSWHIKSSDFKVYDLDREDFTRPLPLKRSMTIDFGDEE